MKILTEGHRYELDSFEGGTPQVIQFIEKVPITEGSTELSTVNDGTTNEEILTMLIDRLNYLHSILPCEDTIYAAKKCDEARALLQKRTADRIARDIKGKKIP